MPVESCSLNGKPGFRYGERGKCYTYTPGDKSSMQEARRKANNQGIAIRAAGYMEKENVVATNSMGSGIKNPQQGYSKPKKKKRNVPTNPSLYALVKAAAKAKFDVYPSAYANAWLVREYKRRGGGYRVVSKSLVDVNKIADDLDQQEALLAEMLIALTKKYGKFDEDGIGVWAGYESPVENDVADIGVKCANCVLYKGGSVCKIIDKAVQPEGKCRFAIIPDGVVTDNDLEDNEEDK